jgi:hypothetical protein
VFKLSETKQITGFTEFFNITNRANFGNNYDGYSTAGALFNTPTTYLGGNTGGGISVIPISFQVQFGARFTF